MEDDKDTYGAYDAHDAYDAYDATAKVTGTVARVSGNLAYVQLDKNPQGRKYGIVLNRDCVKLPECGWLGKKFNEAFAFLYPHKVNRSLWRDSPPRRVPKKGDIVEGEINTKDGTETLKKVTIAAPGR